MNRTNVACFPCSTGSVPRARQFVEKALAEWMMQGEEVDVDPFLAKLVVTELMANAVNASLGGAIELRLSVEERSFEVAVVDDGPDDPRCLEFNPEASRGRGLRIVDELSDDWGFFREAGAKVVWSRLSRAEPAYDE